MNGMWWSSGVCVCVSTYRLRYKEIQTRICTWKGVIRCVGDAYLFHIAAEDSVTSLLFLFLFTARIIWLACPSSFVMYVNFHGGSLGMNKKGKVLWRRLRGKLHEE